MRRHGWSSDLQLEALRPHLWCSHQPTLATGPGAHTVQDRRVDVQSSVRHCTTLPRAAHSCCWCARSATSSLRWHQPSGRAARQTINRRQPSISGCRLVDLEFTAWRRDVGIDSAIIPAAAEDSSVSTMFLCTIALLVDLAVICHLDHFI